MLVLQARGLRAGTSALSIENAQLSDRDGVAIAATTDPGEVIVSTEGPSGPTSTPIPVVTAQVNFTPDPNLPTAAPLPSATPTLGDQATLTPVPDEMIGTPVSTPAGLAQPTSSVNGGATVPPTATAIGAASTSGTGGLPWFWIILTLLEIALIVWIVMKLRSRKKKAANAGDKK